MRNQDHIDILNQGKLKWNTWLSSTWKNLPEIQAYTNRPYTYHKSKGLSLRVANLSNCDLSSFAEFEGYNFKRVNFDNSILRSIKFMNCEFRKSSFINSDLRDSKFVNCKFDLSLIIDSNLSHCTFVNCQFLGANLSKSEFYKSKFDKCHFEHSNLMWSKFINSNFIDSSLFKVKIYGISIWDITLINTTQEDLVITKRDEPIITIDDIQIAQFIYLILDNSKIKSFIENTTSKLILILGRFSEKRLKILYQIKNSLRKQGYVPIIFDFVSPNTKNFTETIKAISQLSKAVIADISDPKCIPQEIASIIPFQPSTSIYPIISSTQLPFAMFSDWESYPWVKKITTYNESYNLENDLEKFVSEIK